MLLTLPFIGVGQDMKIKWEDNDGREFSIKAISGEFDYGMIPGDNVYYNSLGKVSSVGNVNIYYNSLGKVRSVGNVNIYYNSLGYIRSVGGMSIYYNSLGYVSSTTGRVR